MTVHASVSLSESESVSAWGFSLEQRVGVAVCVCEVEACGLGKGPCPPADPPLPCTGDKKVQPVWSTSVLEAPAQADVVCASH